jgi:hypothetical protein
MSTILETAAELLQEHGYVVVLKHTDVPHLLFESEECLGLMIAFADPETLLGNWSIQSAALLEAQKLGLRRSLEKAWNSYLVLLSAARADRLQQALMDSVEEDLVGTRKIARAGMTSREEIARAILPLLPLQSAPNLQPVDMKEEVRIRASQLPPAVMDAFLAGRDASTVMQLLEEM